MSQASDADELFEVASDELRTVVGDHCGFNTGIFFHRGLDSDFHLGLGHGVAHLPMQQRSRAAIQDRTEVKEGTGDVEIRDIDMPVFMGLQGLNKTTPFSRGFGIPTR